MPKPEIEAARTLLDQLLGKDRNLTHIERQAYKATLQWNDSKVCPYFLVGVCPYETFNHTKSDLGNCTRIHDLILQTNFKRQILFG